MLKLYYKICIWAKYVVKMMYVQSVWFLSLYSCYRVAANMEATEPSVPSGEIEVITWKVLRSLHDLVDRYGVSVVQMTTDMFHLSKSQSSPFSMHDLSRVVTRHVRHMKQELIIPPERLSLLPVFSEIGVVPSFIFCLMFCRYRCPFSSGNYLVCPFSIYGFWLCYLYHQTFL